MGRGETSDVSGIPTLNRLLSNIDECNANHTNLSKKFDDFKSEITEKVEEEVNKVRKNSMTSDTTARNNLICSHAAFHNAEGALWSRNLKLGFIFAQFCFENVLFLNFLVVAPVV